MQQPLALGIQKLQHIGIPVSNLRNSESFYGRLGFKNVMEASFKHNGEAGTAIMMQFEDIIIELYQMPDKELDAIRERPDGHIDHIAFDVSDIDTAFATLQQAGLHIFEEAPVYLSFWKNGCKYFNVEGPDGERLEFNQIL
jgi:catechol 2,3-dioxygenase-like lactoylglutathione lyase family enzyme